MISMVTHEELLAAELAARKQTIANVAKYNARQAERARQPTRPDFLRDAVPLLAGMSASPIGLGADQRDSCERDVRLPSPDLGADAIEAYDRAAAHHRLEEVRALDTKIVDAALYDEAGEQMRRNEIHDHFEDRGRVVDVGEA